MTGCPTIPPAIYTQVGSLRGSGLFLEIHVHGKGTWSNIRYVQMGRNSLFQQTSGSVQGATFCLFN